jgi:hypothetical protein
LQRFGRSIDLFEKHTAKTVLDHAMSWLDWLRKKVDTTTAESGASHGAGPEAEDDLPDPPMSGGDNTSSELAGLDFYSAIATHQRWKNRLKGVVTGQTPESLDAAVVGRCDACALGMWLETQSGNARVPPHLLEQLKLEHAQFHELAANIIRLSDQGRTEEALQGLRTDAPYNRTSHRVIGLLSRIYLELSEFHKPNTGT